MFEAMWLNTKDFVTQKPETCILIAFIALFALPKICRWWFTKKPFELSTGAREIDVLLDSPDMPWKALHQSATQAYNSEPCLKCSIEDKSLDLFLNHSFIGTTDGSSSNRTWLSFSNKECKYLIKKATNKYHYIEDMNKERNNQASLMKAMSTINTMLLEAGRKTTVV